LADFEAKKETIESSIKDFTGSAESMKDELLQLKEKLEQLLETVESSIEVLTRGIDQTIPLDDTIRNFLTDQCKDLETAIEEENMNYIVKKINGKEPGGVIGVGDGEKRLVEAVNETVTYFLKSDLIENFNMSLKEMVTIYREFAYQSASKVVSNYVCGICSTQSNYTRLCMYDIQTKKMTPAVPVLQWCTITQLGKQIFLSGGCNPVITNMVSEFVEESQQLVYREPMKYPKHSHRTEAISPTCFITIGGNNGTSSISYCEEYSATNNQWHMLPNLNKARFYAGTAVIGKYVYAIGGRTTNGEIERLDLTEKKQWVIVNAVLNEMTFTSDTLGFSSSAEEIILLRGGNLTEVAVYNVKQKTVKKQAITLKGDYYRFNPVCLIGRNAYVIGHLGHIHIYKATEKKFEEIDYQTAITN
jgi:2-hydroxy-3-keto-5-methylthiopentenyl-1-phosphate phosphatase